MSDTSNPVVPEVNDPSVIGDLGVAPVDEVVPPSAEEIGTPVNDVVPSTPQESSFDPKLYPVGTEVHWHENGFEIPAVITEINADGFATLKFENGETVVQFGEGAGGWS
jgi:hypothetical protein